jgi:hypothetical protein
MGRGVTIPGGVGLAGVIVYLLIQVLAGGGSAGAYGVDNPFGAAPQAPAADGGGIPGTRPPPSGRSTARLTSAATWT